MSYTTFVLRLLVLPIVLVGCSMMYLTSTPESMYCSVVLNQCGVQGIMQESPPLSTAFHCLPPSPPLPPFLYLSPSTHAISSSIPPSLFLPSLSTSSSLSPSFPPHLLSPPILTVGEVLCYEFSKHGAKLMMSAHLTSMETITEKKCY